MCILKMHKCLEKFSFALYTLRIQAVKCIFTRLISKNIIEIFVQIYEYIKIVLHRFFKNKIDLGFLEIKSSLKNF